MFGDAVVVVFVEIDEDSVEARVCFWFECIVDGVKAGGKAFDFVERN
jgi:hypothetical protein